MHDRSLPPFTVCAHIDTHLLRVVYSVNTQSMHVRNFSRVQGRAKPCIFPTGTRARTHRSTHAREQHTRTWRDHQHQRPRGTHSLTHAHAPTYTRILFYFTYTHRWFHATLNIGEVPSSRAHTRRTLCTRHTLEWPMCSCASGCARRDL